MFFKFFYIILFFVANTTLAFDWQENKKNVYAETLPKNGIFFKDNEYYFGIKFNLEDGWKTYWKNPGDAGSALSIDWENEKNINSWKILFPFPEIFVDKGVTTIGYDKEVIFPVKIKLNQTNVLNEKIKLNYLVCKEVCIPISESKDINLDFKNIIQSKEFDRSFFNVPKNHSNSFKLSLIETSKRNLTFEIRNFTNKFKDLEVFGFSEECGLRVETFLDKERNPKFKIYTDEDIRSLKKPIFISISDGNKFEEITFDIKTKSKKSYIGYYLILAFFGGLILNFMPCVLPVLSLKLYTFTNLKYKNYNSIRINSLLIVAGIITSFLVLALIVIILKSLGQIVGWGFQFQNIYFLIIVTTIILLFSFNLLGFYEIVLPRYLQDKVNKFLDSNSRTGHFLSGAFATLLATPCSAPFLGTAVGFAMVASNPNVLIIFFFISMGFALPYFCFIFFPKIILVLPKPGEWMLNFRYLLGLLLLFSSIWLMNVLNIDFNLVVALTIIILFLSYINKRNNFKRFAISISLLFLLFFYSEKSFFKDKEIVWQTFNYKLLKKYLDQDKIVLVDVTADWCVTCQINKMTTLKSNRLRDYIMKNEIVTIRADWTKKNIEILEYIKNFDRYGIPVNIIYGPKNKEGILLPEIISNDIVLDKLFTVGFYDN